MRGLQAQPAGGLREPLPHFLTRPTVAVPYPFSISTATYHKLLVSATHAGRPGFSGGVTELRAAYYARPNSEPFGAEPSLERMVGVAGVCPGYNCLSVCITRLAAPKPAKPPDRSDAPLASH